KVVRYPSLLQKIASFFKRKKKG
ncbi:DUF956 domain-containing protein, partial [Streptococcus mutans]|nr:DUF956 domain-containing protein [Streptococcus mutans]